MTDVMTTKKPKKQQAPSLIPVELIDQLLAQVQNKDAESILGESGVAGQLKKMLAERMLTAELSHHLVSEGEASQNHHNGSSPNLALGIRAGGRKEVLGLWVEQTEGAKFWLKVFNELKNRGLDDGLETRLPGRQRGLGSRGAR